MLRRPLRRAWWIIAGITAAVLAAHGGAVRGTFHYDDLFAIVNNPAVRAWQPARAFAQADAVNSERNAAGYRPLTVTSFALNHRLSGLDPFGYLATNLALHALAAVMVFLVGRALFRDLRWAALAGVTFALHPLNAEAVNYVVARSSLQSTLFALTATWAYFRCADRAGSALTLSVGLVAFVAAMLSKESSVALLVPLLAYPWFRQRVPSGRSDRESTVNVRRIAAAYLAAAVLFVALWRAITAGGVVAPGPAERPAWTFAELVARSLILWIWPWPLGLDHPLTFLTRFDAGLAVALVAGFVGLGLACVFLVRRVPIAAWGLLWAVAGLAPLAPLPWLTTVGLFQEHRLGFSAAGLSWMTAALVREVWTVAHSARAARWALTTVGVVLAILAAGVDRVRSAVWEDDRRLWAEVVERSPNNLLARINLGAAYMEHGEYDRAEAEYRAILALAPAYPRVHHNLGLLALRRGRSDEATAAFERAVALEPGNATAYTHLGILALKRGDERAAEAAFQAALRIDPIQRDALNNLATIYLQRREWSRALELVTEALRRDPTFLEAAYNRGVALAGLGRRLEADAVLQEVRGRLPSDTKFDPYRVGIDHLLAGGSP